MLNRKKRVLWLLNHETLRDFEVPLLVRLGYEVFTPKIFPKTEEFGSGSVDFSFDRTLSIPPEELIVLNQHDFYTQQITPQVAAILNRYFSIAIFGSFPFLLEQIVSFFSGYLFCRTFGREHSNSYTSLLSYTTLKKIYRSKQRFFFAQAYPFLSEVEAYIYQKKALTLPLGVSDILMKECNSWRGGNKKLLFVCPRITQSPYYKNIYNEFKHHFSDVPHLIAGKQFFQMDDPAIQGCLPREQYNNLLRSSEVMFYHSQEPRHLHYHPIEAILFGLPLIYMRKGVISRLIDNKALPGACDSYEEAKKKINIILSGDTVFINEVIHSQGELLKPFKADYCESVWREVFIKETEKRLDLDNNRFSVMPFLLFTQYYLSKKLQKYLTR